MVQGKKQASGPRQKHVPQRMCIACRRTEGKRGLIRLVRTVEGRVEIDPSGKRNGRGAYMCHDPACWEQALKRHALERALRLPTVTPDDRALLTAFAQTLEHAIQTEDEPAATQQ